jgi:hypothetical protein
MKEQITALQEALRLIQREVEQFKRGKTRDATLDSIERILDDPHVSGAIQALEPLLNSPSIVPEGVRGPEPATSFPEVERSGSGPS